MCVVCFFDAKVFVQLFVQRGAKQISSKHGALSYGVPYLMGILYATSKSWNALGLRPQFEHHFSQLKSSLSLVHDILLRLFVYIGVESTPCHEEQRGPMRSVLLFKAF